MKNRRLSAHLSLRTFHLLSWGLLAAALPRMGVSAGADSALVAPASHAGKNELWNVRAFGAKGDGKSLDSPAINRAIEACAQAGGGTVWLPAGTYLSGSIHLMSCITLCLDTGATILGAPQEMNAYDPAEPFEGRAYQDGGHTYFHNSLIWGENLTNVAITGLGMINGGGLIKGDSPRDHGNKSIVLKNCRSVLIRDVTIYHGGHFAILTTGCDNLTIDNVTIDTNRDGIDLDCCRNTIVSNCRINSPSDDGLCPKSTYALGRKVITENLTIVNCQVSGFNEGALLAGKLEPRRGGMGRIKFGTESTGGFRNVTIANCTFRSCKGLALEEVDGGIMENISISNLTMMDVWDYPIYITLGRRKNGPQATTSILRNISIANVIATGVDRKSGIQITGLPERPIEGVRLQNIRLVFEGGGTPEDAAHVPPELGKGYPEPSRLGTMPAYGVFARHVKDLELADIRLNFDREEARPAMVLNDVDGAEIANFKAQVGSGVSPARFENVKGLVIRDSPVLEGARTIKTNGN
jgi:polygalacturonase